MLFHHLHQHSVSLHVSVSALVSTSVSLFIYLYLNPRQNLTLHIVLGENVTIASTAVEMGVHDQVVPCHPLVWIDSQPAMSERGIWHATQIERQRNETHPGNRRRKDSL